MSRPVKLSGTTLEGGGQLLRLAIGLSALTEVPVEITDIRGNRPGGGGLKGQHLTSVNWLREACDAKVDGAGLKSRRLLFEPQSLRDDISYNIRQSTPGSVALIFQAVLPIILFSGRPGPVKLSISGGTNVSNSPSIEYLKHVLVPMLHLIGLPLINIDCSKRGWSVGRSGIGSVTFDISPLQLGSTLPAFNLTDRGGIISIKPVVLAPQNCLDLFQEVLPSIVENAFAGVAIEEFEVGESWHEKRFYLLIVATTTNGIKLARDWLYDRKVLPGNVDKVVTEMSKQVVHDLKLEIAHGGCVDEHMQDQLVVFQALANGCSRVTGGERKGKPNPPSLHTQTARWVAGELLGIKFDENGETTGVALKSGEEYVLRKTSDGVDRSQLAASLDQLSITAADE